MAKPLRNGNIPREPRSPPSELRLIAEIRRAAARVRGHFTLTRFARASGFKPWVISTRFGSWRDALLRADLLRRYAPRAVGNKYTWEECYKNLDRLWRYYRRAPKRHEVNGPPSRIGIGTYQLRFGTWSNALAAFVAARDGDARAWPMPGARRGRKQRATVHGRKARAATDFKREILEGPLRPHIYLRHRVFLRDRFRCTLCGASPANDPDVILHVDHARPIAKGGRATLANLRTLCAECNLGKGTTLLAKRLRREKGAARSLFR
jgi:hypothetical protein